MPLRKTTSSTVRRRNLANFIDSSGNTMVKACSTCVLHSRVCKVHIRSGKCSECLRRGQRCDLRVSQSEWERLKAEKEKLRCGIREAYEAQERAREDLRIAFAKEMRLRQQMDFLDKRVDEAVSVEVAAIQEEDGEVLDFNLPPSGPSLSPHTWSAIEELPDSFWSNPLPGETVG